MIQPIPTTYRGVTFRSRLEARWAVFYDTLGIEWHYEHEGYQLPSGWYLPDFWLPHVGAFLEIKPPEVPDSAVELCRELNKATGSDVYLFGSDAPCVESTIAFHWGDGVEDNSCGWVACQRCRAVKLVYLGESDYRTCRCGAWMSEDAPSILAAIDAARTARFW